MRFIAKPVKTRYWHPGDDYIHIVVDTTKRSLKDNDVVVISEKAVSTASGNLIDEAKVKPGKLAIFIARFWMRYVWGHFLGWICRLKPETIRRLRTYPLKEGSAHKQVALNYAGLLQALRHGSEGGIDVTNVPYAFACLPLRNPNLVANRIQEAIKVTSGKNVTVIISDTDMTYSFGKWHITPRPNPIAGIASLNLLAYIIGRFFKGRPRATPLAIAGPNLSVEDALNIAELAHHVRRSGAGKTAWDMAEKFGVSLTGVTWSMLEGIDHYPIVIVRRRMIRSS
ncbi:coenzyme F420-0:L-glutamate ligase [Candidatus Bathyarchaeota archaeon]|nr:coenzyme F420-0:L-glutamate ligase [Candidatus Bathyarchaeota archaeon]